MRQAAPSGELCPGRGAGKKSPSVIIFGATSAIARALAREFAALDYTVCLASRVTEEAEAIAADLAIRHGIQTSCLSLDLEDVSGLRSGIEDAWESSGGFDVVVMAAGQLPDQKTAQGDPLLVERAITANFSGPAAALTVCAGLLERQKSGTIVCFSSVAADRGRPSNYVYGSAKAGLTVFLQGLGLRMREHGVRVVTIKPGFVDTRMTFGKEGLKFMVSPSDIARGVMNALRKGKSEVYLPPKWRLIMLAVRLMPGWLLVKLRL